VQFAELYRNSDCCTCFIDLLSFKSYHLTVKKILRVSLIVLISLIIGCSPKNEVTEPPDPYVGRPIKSVTTLVGSLTKTLDWCPANNLIAFEQYGADGYVDIYVLNPENNQNRTLTDGNPRCP
jgi:hypothetical protein